MGALSTATGASKLAALTANGVATDTAAPITASLPVIVP